MGEPAPSLHPGIPRPEPQPLSEALTYILDAHRPFDYLLRKMNPEAIVMTI